MARPRRTPPKVDPDRNILETIMDVLSELRASDRKVAELVLADYNTVLHDTVAETAAKAGVSVPTVLRFCADVGCDGYQQFKLKLAQAAAFGLSATHSALALTDSPGTVVDKIFDFTLSSFDWARRRIDPAAVEAALTLLMEVRRIEFFGLGASGIVALDAQQKFPLFGIPCGAQIDIHQQLMTASMLDSDAAAVFISNTGRTHAILESARVARDHGARIIGITGDPKSGLCDFCEVCLVVQTLDNTEVYTPSISRLAALVIIDILASGVALRKHEVFGEQIVRMKRLLAQKRSEGF